MRKLLLLLTVTFSFTFSAETFLQIFGDLRAGYSSEEGRLNFTLGDTDLLGFLIHKNFKVLIEMYLEQPEAILDVERGYAELKVENFSFRLGKFHTPLGYFNRAWHHGLYLMTPIDRPLIVSFEDEGGPLPVHMVGVGFDAKWRSLGLSLVLGNGNLHLGSTNTSDLDNKKSFLGKLYFSWDPYSEAGMSFGYDPMEVNDPEVGYVRTENYILGLHVAYKRPGFAEVNGEVYMLEERVSGKGGSGGFLLLSYPLLVSKPLGEVRPYIMLEFLNWEMGNPWFESIKKKLEEEVPLRRRTKYTLGVKITPFAYMSVKLEVFYEDLKEGKNAWAVRAFVGFGIPVVR